MWTKRQSGFSLVEMIATIVILAVALTGLTLALSNGLGRSAQSGVEVRAVALAQAYLDEVLSKRYDEKTRSSGVPPCRASAPASRQCTAEISFGPDGGETRSGFDDVDDYDGLVQGDGETDPLQDADGVERDGYENFRVTIDVRYIDIASAEPEENLEVDGDLDDEFDAKLITVTVFFRGMTDGFPFSAYAANF